MGLRNVDLIYRNLIGSTVRIQIPNAQGTGFFVSSGLLLTCRHVVKKTAIDAIEIFWRENRYTPTKVKPHPELDLALLWVDIGEHLYVALDADFNPFDECHAFGYPLNNLIGNWVRCLAAPNEDSATMSLDSKVIRPGLSGAPLLNIRTNKVCGLINTELQVRLRGNVLLGFGGTGIPVQKILEIYPELRNIDPHPQWLIENSQGREAKFIETLHDFNYREEVGIFAEFLGADAPVGAFLICGEEQTGQRWLLNRLWQDEVRASTSGVKYKFRVTKKWTIETIWERVGGVLGVAPDPDSIAQQMYEYWQNSEPVSLILYSIEKLKKTVLKELIEKLWQPLANCAKNSSSEVPLLLFLVDTSGNQEIDCIRSYNSNFPDVPVRIKLKEKFKDRDINSWANRHRNTIIPLFYNYCLRHNLNFTKQPIQNFKTKIKQYNLREDITPEEVLQKICELCNHDWEEDFASKFVI